ncbi:hypothetical protein BX611_0039 [Lutibacter oceani]|uniref:Uncharacterized protein n=1 Tax=Lutibacter oceani TaxID=1853311 RepID=A0A3D9RS83_9FLAO|nr:hypothetical protein [Lutibacter oceani]REE82770.1 hypothetical protein BX611_0039 [Lutibacter oceani]
MKNIFLAIAICLLIISCKTENKKVENNTKKNEVEIVETPLLTLGEFDTKAGEFVGKEIQVKGIVDHVCKHGGKKILLVTDEGDAHVFSEERFDEALMGSEIKVTGIVLEERIDEAYCLKMEEDNIKSHSEGVSNQEQFENKKKHIQQLRDQMKEKGVDYISNYSLQYVSLENIDAE